MTINTLRRGRRLIWAVRISAAAFFTVGVVLGAAILP
jgi:hypothetical protein